MAAPRETRHGVGLSHLGQGAFMQKNLPDSAPEWIPRVGIWAEASKREVHYALCNDVRTLTWFANQRAVEYHPALWRVAARAERLDPALATTAFVKDERDGKVFVDATRVLGATVAVAPRDFTIHTVPALLAGGTDAAPGPEAWTAAMARPQTLPADLVAEGHTIPVARVQAMHESKRRKRAAESR